MFNLLNLKNTGLRKKYILSFILVSMIPVFITLLIYFPVISIIKNEVVEKDSIRTNAIMAVMDERILEMYNLSVQMASHKTIREFIYKKAPLNNVERYYIKDIVDLLKSYKISNNFISLIALYLIQSSSVVTHEGVYSADYFFENVLGYEDLEVSELKQIMARKYYNEYVAKRKIRGNGPLNGEYITYIQTIPIGGKEVFANVIMLVDQKNIRTLIGDKANTNQRVLILTKDNEFVYSDPKDEQLKRLFLDKLGRVRGSFVVDITKGSTVVVSYSISQVNGWKYIVFSSMDNIFLEMNKIRNLTIVISIVSFGVGILLSILMANFNYKPWIHLMDQIGRFYSKAMAQNHVKSENEYIIAVNAINDMLMEKEQLERDMVKSKGYITKYILQNLCLGKSAMVDINRKEIIFPYKLYSVIIIDMDDRAQLNSKLERLLTKLVGMYFDSSLIYTFEDEKGRLCVVLNTASYGITLIVEVIRRLRDLISMHFDVPLYVGIGGIYEDISMLHISYKEAKKALEYCLLKGRDCVVFYPDINKYIFTSMNLPIYSDNPLLNSVKVGDVKSCVKLLDEYFENIGDGVASIQYMCCLFYNFVSIIIKACNEINVSFEEVFAQTPEQILDIDRYRNPKQIINGIYNIYTTMCDYIQRNKKSQNSNLKKHIEDYIRNNYMNKGLSLVEMANKLGYSSSYLSRFINQEFGMGFGELLNKVRIEHAKSLLASELRSISEISDVVGYTSVNSFIRAFKREEGITPSQYRNIVLQNQLGGKM